MRTSRNPRRLRRAEPGSPTSEMTNASTNVVLHVIAGGGLALLAFAGYFKGSPLFANLPLDLSLVGALFTAVPIAVWLLRRPFAVPHFRLIFAFLLLFAVAAIPSVDVTEYSRPKTLEALILVPLTLMGGISILRFRRARAIWLVLVVALGFLVGGLALAFPDVTAADLGRLSLEGGSTIGISRGMSAAVVVLFISALFGRRFRLLTAAAGVALALIMVMTGSRGPVLSAVIAVAATVCLAPQRGRSFRILAGGFALAAVVVGVVASEFASDRLRTFQDTSTQARIVLWEAAARTAAQNPFGIGWGQFYWYLRPQETLDTGYTQYPHNLVLEVAVEAGWLAALILIVLIAYAVWEQARSATTPVEAGMLGFLILMVASAMVSGDVPGNRGVWLALGASFVAGGAFAPSSSQRDATGVPQQGGSRIINSP